MKAIGDLNNLNQNLLGIMCSQSCPGDLILKGFDAAKQIRDQGTTVVSGFHSSMEKDIIEILLRGSQPIIHCLAKAIETYRIPQNLRQRVECGLLTIIAPDFPIAEKRITKATSERCNSLVLDICDQVPFFRNLTLSDLEWINLLFHETDFKTDEIICQSWDTAKHLYIIADGRVRLLRYSLTGKNILLDLLTTGEFFGALSGLGNDVYPETAQAHTSCCILIIDREAFQQVLKRYPFISLNLINIMVERLRIANERVHQLSALTVEARIACILLMLTAKFGETKGSECLLQVPLFREDLAGMTGATTESASRVMSRFQKEGLIRSGRGWVAVINRKGLEEITGKELE